jgi:uncharacterized repeat protein (TIGR01451 family)
MSKILLAVSATVLFTSGAFAQAVPPTFTKGFFQGLGTTPQTTLPADGTTTATLRFTITNNDPTTGLTNIAFTDTLPAGLLVATPNGVQGTCGGAVAPVATAGSNTITLTGGSLAAAPGPFNFCSFVVNVVGITPGLQTNTTGPLTATNALGAPDGTLGATAAITVLSLVAPTLTKTFSTPFIAVGQVATLTLTVNNTNATALTGVAFTDTLPAGLLIATPNGLISTCGAVTATVGTNVIGLAAGTVAANAACTITVNVVGTAPVSLTNTTSTITTTNAGTGAVATAGIVVIPPDAFQVRYASNLGVGDSVIDITNTGASSTIAFPTQNGNICANAYVFSPDEQLISCCSCVVTPDGLASLSARNDLISNTLTPAVPTSIVIKLVASAGTVTAGVTTCNASTVTPASIALAAGLAAWGTTLHASPVTPGTPTGSFGLTETPFSRGTLSPAELTRITTLCGFIGTNGSGFGVCRSCRLGGLGADRQ